MSDDWRKLADAAEDVVGTRRSLVRWGRPFWEAVDLLRGHSVSPAAGTEALLGLLYLRIRHRAVWAELTSGASWSEAEAALLQERSVTADDELLRILRTSLPQEPLLTRLIRAANALELLDEVGGDAVVADVLCQLLAGLAEPSSRFGDQLTPDSLVRCMVTLADPQPDRTVHDPYCRSGELLARAARELATAQGPAVISGMAPDERSWRLCKLIMASGGVDADLGPGPSDALAGPADGGHRRFDLILTNPPFNARAWRRSGRWKYGDPPQHNANFAWLQHVESALTDEGRAVVLMPNSAGVSENPAEAAIRAGMIKDRAVECVVALPSQLFRSTIIPVSIWVLRGRAFRESGQILFVDATDLGTMLDRAQRVLTVSDIARIGREYRVWREDRATNTYRATAGFAWSASEAQLNEFDHVLNPRVYVEPAVPAADQARTFRELTIVRYELTELRERSQRVWWDLDGRLSGIDLKVDRPTGGTVPHGWSQPSLGEVCEIQAGPGTVADRDRMQGSRWIPVVLPRNLRHHHVTEDDLDGVPPNVAAGLGRYGLEAGDVVGTRTGELGRYAFVDASQAGWLLGPGCLRLRPAAEVDGLFLTYYLSSPAAGSWLQRNAGGAAIKNISSKTIAKMPVVLPPLDVQRRIGATLGELDIAVGVQERIAARTQSLRDLLLVLLLAGAADPVG